MEKAEHRRCSDCRACAWGSRSCRRRSTGPTRRSRRSSRPDLLAGGRERARPHRGPALTAVAAPLEPAVRAGLDLGRVPGAGANLGDDAAGVIVLSPDGSTVFANDVAAAWIEEMGANGSLPRAVTATASQARAVVDGRVPEGRTPARACGPNPGLGSVVRASALGNERRANVAVTIEPARPHELAPLVADAYGLTERGGDQARRQRAAHRCDRHATAPVAVDGSRSPQGGLREGRRRYARRAGGPRVLLAGAHRDMRHPLDDQPRRSFAGGGIAGDEAANQPAGPIGAPSVSRGA